MSNNTKFNPHAYDPWLMITKAVSRMEARALSQVNIPEGMAGDVIVDPYGKQHPADSDAWQYFLARLKGVDDGYLYYICMVIRGNGAELIKHSVHGFIIRPIIGGENTWTEIDYNEFKTFIAGHESVLLDALHDTRAFIDKDWEGKK